MISARAITVTNSGLQEKANLIFVIQLYDQASYATLQVSVQNTTGNTLTLRAFRSLELLGDPLLNLGGHASADRVLSDSYSEDRPHLQLYDLGKAPDGMHRGVGSQLIYNPSRKMWLRGSPTCGPFLENNVFTRANGTVVNGTRGPFPNTIGTDAWYKNMGNANYNALQFTLKRATGPLTLLASYTYGKSLEQSSSIQEQVYPYNYREEYAPSAFDIKHNFVVSYNYELPFARLSGKANRLTDGWALSGITRLATGLPVTFASFSDNALVYVQNNGVNSVSIDLPNYTPGNLQINHNPRNRASLFQHVIVHPECFRDARKRQAALLLRAGHQQFRRCAP